MTTAISRLHALFLIFAITLLIAASAAIAFVPATRGDEKMSTDPWTAAQILRPSDLARELNRSLPAAIFRGPRFMAPRPRSKVLLN